MAKRAMFKMASRLVLHPWFRWTRGMTLGVRCLVHDGEDRVLLVRHTYAPGWLLPGGGVERGETVHASMVRELDEETSVLLTGPARLFGFYSNEANFCGDHIALFVVDRFSRGDWTPSREIAEAAFFPRNDLPDDTTTGTRRRLAEVFDAAPVSPHW